jgi:adenylate cyclase
MQPEVRFAIAEWLARESLAGATGEALLEGFAARLEAAGLRVLRASATLQSLDPVVGALLFRWWRPDGRAACESFRRPADGGGLEVWPNTPFYALYHGDAPRLRYRLADPAAAAAFPLLGELRAAGATDYIAIKVAFGAAGAGEGVLSSWTTDRPGGFTADDLADLEALWPLFHLALHTAALSAGAATLLTTYLGRDTARRVLAGAVQRGVPDRLDAVLWASDLAGFTRLADTQAQDRVIDLLNAYAEVAVDAVTEAGGEVSKFMGDGLLAVFDRTTVVDAPAAALGAAETALAGVEALGERRAGAGLPTTRLRIALHVGEVFYGNVGAPARLDFTVVGPAVNEAARLCDMCRSLDQELVLSAAFHAAAERRRERLVGLGRYALRGVGRPQHLYTLDRTGA